MVWAVLEVWGWAGFGHSASFRLLDVSFRYLDACFRNLGLGRFWGIPANFRLLAASFRYLDACFRNLGLGRFWGIPLISAFWPRVSAIWTPVSAISVLGGLGSPRQKRSLDRGFSGLVGGRIPGFQHEFRLYKGLLGPEFGLPGVFCEE